MEDKNPLPVVASIHGWLQVMVFPGRGGKKRRQPGREVVKMEGLSAPDVSSAGLLKRLTLDFTAILIGYNIPREDARRVAARAIEPVREHFAVTGSTLRLTRG